MASPELVSPKPKETKEPRMKGEVMAKSTIRISLAAAAFATIVGIPGTPHLIR